MPENAKLIAEVAVAQPKSHDDRLASIISGDDHDPFSYLGMHRDAVSKNYFVRVFRPDADAIEILTRSSGEQVAKLTKINAAGLFSASVGLERFDYRLLVDGVVEDDPYAFGPVLGDIDLYLHAEGKFLQAYEKMGAHPISKDGVEGTSFAVWAPNARRVSVVGDFNGWDGRRHPMRLYPGAGIWEIFLPAIGPGTCYKFEIKTREGGIILKADPFAFQAELPPKTASVVAADARPGALIEAMGTGPSTDRHAPVAIYEVHLGSWRKVPEEGGRSLTYRELADTMVPYVKEMGFTHIELMPINEHPFGGSWGYQPTSLFAPTSRYGTPEDFRHFVHACHEAGIGVILDWAAGHFPSDAHGLHIFDGTFLYEHADPREGYHPDWNSYIYNFGRNEVRGFLLANALFWLKRYGIDGLRVDAVASMLYRNYSRKAGEWVPNIHGGVENLEAVDFLRRMNELVYADNPDAVTIAEESTSWPMVSRPTYLGGLGFGYKWNMGWMHDTLQYMSHQPIHRKYHHNSLTFGLLYAFSENFVLPLSHDEVVHGKGSLLTKMPGDLWQKFANLRAYYTFMYTMPGKKLLFMGAEIAQWNEWDNDASLDWHLLQFKEHAGLNHAVKDLNWLYRNRTALHQKDCEPDGFAWIDCNDTEASVISYIRRGQDPDDFVIVVCNFTPVVRENYRIGVPKSGRYYEAFNSDSEYYGGSNVGNAGSLQTQGVPVHGQPDSLCLTLPPLGAFVLVPEGR
ncbi:MAG: 1,4-alpha-glucan branching protein GlgB [Rhizomicrobium sp.]|nr:1,4-alpha-glucan branching protein GlgB [Rhizomicrobium sp.]